jgi:hypothetical protein
MKKLPALLVLAGLSLCATGCNLFGSPDDLKPWSHTSDELRYKITFPAKWGWFEDTDLEFYAISPEKDGASFHVTGTAVAGRSEDPRPLMDLVAETVEKIEERHGIQSMIFPAEQRDGRTVIPTIAFLQSGGTSYTRKTLYFEQGDYFGAIDFTGPGSRFSTDAEIRDVDSSLTFF